MNIGVDHIAAYIPNQYLALEDLALARNVDPKKFLVGLGNREMAIASPNEDVVVLASNAGKRVLEEAVLLDEAVDFADDGRSGWGHLAPPFLLSLAEHTASEAYREGSPPSCCGPVRCRNRSRSSRGERSVPRSVRMRSTQANLLD